MKNLRLRILRTLIAASTLHLMLAVPVRACPAEMAPAARATMTDTAMPAMMHGAHQMQHETAPTSPSAPDRHDGAPCDHEMPCCPPASQGCANMTCATMAPVAMVASNQVLWQTVRATAPVRDTWHGVSFVHAPEPPPPKA